MGCTRATSTAELWPVHMVSTMPIRPVHPAIFTDERAMSRRRPRMSIHPLTPMTNIDASTQPSNTAWRNLCTATGENATAQKSSMTLRIWAGSNSMPTGYCIQALATSIHRAEMVAPTVVSHVEAR